MKSVNGDANADLIRICKENGAKRFVYLSAYEVENEITIPFITGYFQGKRIAEQAVQKFFPGTHGTILHPGMIYGTRIQNGLVIPLSIIGAPLEFIMNLPGFNQLRKIPILGKVTCSPPVSVHSVANCVVKAATGQLDEQYNYDNDVLNDNNEANPEFKQHHSAIVLEIPQIAACRP
jgi:nucleoside-diphosphate-sugar epimerase